MADNKYDKTPVLSQVQVGTVKYYLKDADAREAIDQEILDRAAADTTLQGNITAEETRAKGAEGGLDTRIRNLEARGRYLSTWDVSTGLPGDYPEIPEGSESPYTYTYKAGDYFIINNVPASGTKYMPDGASITATKSGETWTWEIGKKEYSGTSALVVGGQFLYSKTSWTYVATAKDVAWGNITGNLEDQTDLKNALDAKLKATATVAGCTFSGDTIPAITTVALQTALGLEDLAYADSASGSTTLDTVDSISMASLTISGDATVTTEDATVESTGSFTPVGTITGSAISGGSISVTIQDAASATAVTDITFESYTPAGTVDGGKVTASGLISGSLATATVGTQIAGTVSRPNVNLTSAEKSFVTGLDGGSVASFTEGTFTPNVPTTLDTSKFNGGSTASFTQGSKATLTTSSITFATTGLVANVGTGTDAECLIFTAAGTATANAVESFTANGDDSFTTNTVASLGDGFYTAGTAASKAADSFTANVLQGVTTATVNNVTAATLATDPVFTGATYAFSGSFTGSEVSVTGAAFTGTPENVKFSGAKYLKQEINTAVFTPTAATLGFTGTAGSVSVSGTYQKAKGAAAFSTTVTPSVSTITRTAKTIKITVTPDTPTV